MATFKDMEDSLKSYIIQEQSDAHNVRNVNVTKYNNIKIWMDTTKYAEPHFFVRISISEAVFTLSDCNKLNGGLGYEERFIYKWFGRRRQRSSHPASAVLALFYHNRPLFKRALPKNVMDLSMWLVFRLLRPKNPTKPAWIQTSCARTRSPSYSPSFTRTISPLL